MIALAHAGITDLRCIVPATLDVHDVIAQLTAITVGHDRRPGARLAPLAGAAAARRLGRPLARPGSTEGQ